MLIDEYELTGQNNYTSVDSKKKKKTQQPGHNIVNTVQSLRFYLICKLTNYLATIL